MAEVFKNFDFKVAEVIRSGGVGVLPTDTIYGLVGTAMNEETVERLRFLRKRGSEKPFIILIASISDLQKFDVVVSEKEKNFLKKVWPGKVSVVLKCENKKLWYLHRGLESLAFRIPADEKLRAVLKQTGPLVAPSANWEGHVPAKNIAEAQKYFGDAIDFYVDGGEINSAPSTLIKLEREKITVIRQGDVKIDK